SLAPTLALAWLVVTSPTFAQVSTGSVNGVVTDAQGSVVPKATIVLTNLATSVGHTTVSNGSGYYAFLNIAPGSYTLAGRASGFSPVDVAAFTLAVNQTATINFHLTVASLSTVV